MKFLNLFLSFVFSGCALASASMFDLPDPVVGFDTKNDWVYIFSKDLKFVQTLCHSNSPGLLGCAKWPGAAKLSKPATSCLIVLLEVADEKEVLDTYLHERRHCTEGEFHS